MEPPFRTTVYSKAFARKGWVGEPVSVAVTPRHNAVGTATITIASDHRRLPDLAADGARVVIDYDGQQILSGPVRRLRGKGPTDQGQVEFDVEDDWRLLARVLGWPVPGAALTAQTSAYDTRTGAAETVLKGFVTANAVTRLGLPVTVAPDQLRGAAVTVKSRFHPLADRLFPMVDQAGIGVTVRQSGAGLVVDCYTPAQHPRTLTEKSGVVTSWGWSKTGPGNTRVVAGDQGQATARSFTQTIDTARESAWGDVIEVFRDARDTDNATEVADRRAETLAEGAPRAGLSVELAETSTFRYGRAVSRGDRVRIEVGPGVFVEDVLREAVLSWKRDEGLQVTPLIGERSDDPDRVLARAISRIARGLRRQEAER